jgi:4-amino-4-deoxy-L-arabinose transferase-like glycosyltransferase
MLSAWLGALLTSLAPWISLILGCGVAWRWRSSASYFGKPHDMRVAYGMLLAILLVATALRSIALEELPAYPDYDSVQNGWIGLQLIASPNYHPVLEEWAEGNETAYFYLLGALLDRYGVSYTILRLPAAIIGVASVLALYLLARELLGNHIALLAACLLTLQPWHVLLSRQAKHPILVPLLSCLALWTLVRGLRATAPNPRWVWLACCGLLTGAGLHTYEAFRAFPLAIVLALSTWRWREQRVGQGFRELAWIAGWAALIALPVVLAAMRDPARYVAHITTHLANADDAGLASTLGRIAKTTIFAVGYLPLVGATSTFPTILALLPLATLVGFAALLRCKPAIDVGSPADAAATAEARSILWSTLIAGTPVFALASFHPYAPRRYVLVAIPLAIIAACGLQAMWRTLSAVTPLATRRACGLFVLLWSLSGAWPLASWLAVCPEHELEPELAPTLAWCLRTVHNDPSATIYLAPGFGDSRYLTRFALSHPRLRRLPLAWPLPDQPLTGTVFYVGWPASTHTMLERWGGRHSAIPQTHGCVTATGIDASKVAQRRGDALSPTLDRAFQGWLLVPMAGRYLFAAQGGGQLDLDGQRFYFAPSAPSGQAAPPEPVALPYGLVQLHFQPHHPGTLDWQLPDGDQLAPLPSTRLWRLDELRDGLPHAPRLTLAGQGARWQLNTSMPVQHHARSSLVPGSSISNAWLDDACQLPTLQFALAMPPVRSSATHRNQRIFQLPALYGGEATRRFSLARATNGAIALLDIELRRLHCFDQLGSHLAEVDLSQQHAAWRPLAVAAMENTWLIADGARCATTHPAPTAAIKHWRATDVAVDQARQRCWWLDPRDQALVATDLAATVETLRVTLPSISTATRLTIDDHGAAWLHDPAWQPTLLRFLPAGTLDAPLGDPAGHAALDRRSEAAWVIHASQNTLAVIGSSTYQRATHLEPTGCIVWPPQDHALDAGPHDFGPGALRPFTSGVAPWARWHIASADQAHHTLYLLYACTERVRCVLVIDGEPELELEFPATGGVSASDLAWFELPTIELEPGNHRLELISEVGFPILANARWHSPSTR